MIQRLGHVQGDREEWDAAIDEYQTARFAAGEKRQPASGQLAPDTQQVEQREVAAGAPRTCSHFVVEPEPQRRQGGPPPATEMRMRRC